MDKGQHLRLFIMQGATTKAISMSTDLSFQGSIQSENSTTKDTTDASGGVWDEFDVTGRGATINFSAMVAVGTDTGGQKFSDILSKVQDTVVNWKLCFANGENNRTMGVEVASGQGKLVNVTATGQVGQKATYQGTLNTYGPIKTVEVASLSFDLPITQANLAGQTSPNIVLTSEIDAEMLEALLVAQYQGDGATPIINARIDRESGTVIVLDELNEERLFELTLDSSNHKKWNMIVNSQATGTLNWLNISL